MRLTPIGAFLLLAAFALPGVAQLTIEGRVIEKGTSNGVAGATVTLDSRWTVDGASQKNERTTQTDAGGNFRFEVSGKEGYNLRATKEGYSSDGVSLGPKDAIPPNAPASVQALGEPVTLAISGSPTITGRVEDFDTGEPLSGVAIEAVQVEMPTRYLGRAKLGSSGEDGTFAIQPETGSGYYLIRVRPELQLTPRIRTDFDLDSWDISEEDYEQTYWPGGGDLKAAIPQLAQGIATVNVGAVRVRKSPVYRALFRFPASQCSEGESFNTHLIDRETGLTVDAPVEVPCGSDLLIVGLSPGPYKLFLTPGETPPAEQRFGRVPFDITDENQEFTIQLNGGVDLDGRIELPSGYVGGSEEQPLSGITVSAIPKDRPGAQRDAQVAEDGTFRLVNLPLEPYDIVVHGSFPAPLFVKGMTLHGIPPPAQVPTNKTRFALDGVGPLEIQLSDRPATITGTVVDAAGNPTDGIVLLSRWPMPPDANEDMGTQGATIPADGTFTVSDLPQGEYRLWALPVRQMINWTQTHQPVTDLGPGAAVKVDEGGSARVEVEMSQP